MGRGDLVELLSAGGLRLLDSLPAYGAGAEALSTVTRLRALGHSPGLVATVLTQARLRARAVPKFGEFAGRMLFTEAGLEQATRLPVAALHAGRFRTAGVRRVADLGCGLGGDAMAMAALDLDVLAVDADEGTAALASYNLEIGRASCRERVEISVVAVSLKKKKKNSDQGRTRSTDR